MNLMEGLTKATFQLAPNTDSHKINKLSLIQDLTKVTSKSAPTQLPTFQVFWGFQAGLACFVGSDNAL
jgi:hypothetical protein